MISGEESRREGQTRERRAEKGRGCCVFRVMMR